MRRKGGVGAALLFLALTEPPTPVTFVACRQSHCQKKGRFSMSGKKLTSKSTASAGVKKIQKSRTAKPDPAVAEREQWAALRPSMKVDQAMTYDMDAAYRTKALVSHSHFGLGVVMCVAGSRKMEVLFEEGKKLLRCQ
jgi:hypothetical protein